MVCGLLLVVESSTKQIEKKKKNVDRIKLKFILKLKNQRESGPILKAMLYMEVRDVFLLCCPILLSLLNPEGGRVF